MSDIKLSMPYVLQNEGGWTIDDGGWTMYGIVVDDVAAFRNVSPESITEQDMRNLSLAEATAIYKQQYWDKLNLDQIKNQNVATCIFDTGVNRGISVGAKYAQKVALVSIDGVIGQKTIAAINATMPSSFIQIYAGLVWSGYQSILAAHPSDHIYAAGWESRAKRLLTLV